MSKIVGDAGGGRQAYSGFLTLEEKIFDDAWKFYSDPLGYVMWAFPWTTDPSIQQVRLKEPWASRFPEYTYGPDAWACEFLDDLGYEIRNRKFNGKEAVEPIRFTTASGHGIGKSTLVAWLIKFILDTRPFSKGVVTANTSDQLRTKTWSELSKWHSISLTSEFFHYTSGRGAMSLYKRGDKNVTATWRCDAQTCREENAEAFQGLHAATATPFYIFDEASGIPDKIFEARSGGATDGEPMWFDFGNPTRKSGFFFENCIGRYRHRFSVRSIDSRTVSITNKALFREWAEDWGEDSDFFKVKVKGEFPSAGSVQFISSDAVRDAMLRPLISNKTDPLIIGVDVARFGDDSTVVYPRIGHDARSFPWQEYKGLDNVQVVEKVIETIQKFAALGKRCEGLFIDGGGLGGGVVDMLRRLGYNPQDVVFNSKALDRRYRFRVDEMWGKMRDAMEHLMLPNNPALFSQLTQREYGFTTGGGKIALESKIDMKDRGVKSPDIADALALTYAMQPASRVMNDLRNTMPQFVRSEYDPLQWKE